MIKLILYNKQDSQPCKYMHDMVHIHYLIIQTLSIALNYDSENQ